MKRFFKFEIEEDDMKRDANKVRKNIIKACYLYLFISQLYFIDSIFELTIIKVFF